MIAPASSSTYTVGPPFTVSSGSTNHFPSTYEVTGTYSSVTSFMPLRISSRGVTAS